MAGSPGGKDGTDGADDGAVEGTESVDWGRMAGEGGMASCEPISESAAVEGAGDCDSGGGGGRGSFFCFVTFDSAGVAGLGGRLAAAGVGGREGKAEGSAFAVVPALRSCGVRVGVVRGSLGATCAVVGVVRG